MSTNPVVFLIGGPDAGKTNFLGRLWLCLRAKTGFLSADHLPEDAKYVAQISQELLRGKFAGHSPLGEMTRNSQIPVQWQDGDDQNTGSIVLPDRKGEQWRKDFRKRIWSAELEDMLSTNAGCLLFIRAASEEIVPSIDPMKYADLFVFPEQVEDTSILEDQSLEPNIQEFTERSQNKEEDNETHLPEDDSEFEDAIPTQVILVDWLQCLRQAFDEVCGYDFRPRIGIVIAAWDLVPEDQKEQGIGRYLKTTFPMLWQFISANSDRYNFQIFASSVAGVDLEIEELQNTYCQGNPRNSGIILHALDGSEETSSDFTLPLAWALGAYRENCD